MTTTRRFVCDDLFRFNNVNLDPLTETYNLSFYLQYLARWPNYCETAESTTGRLMGYILGKDEGNNSDYHGHVTALTVSPEFRRLGLADKFMAQLERLSEQNKCYFVDLFVRKSNEVAINMYRKFGYIVYRTVLNYYSGVEEEDAYDMRKALSRDVDKLSVIPLTHPVNPEDVLP
ncbi:N-acetyltransferase [Capsaspora owczarzaki ATCC 30864]|uniref:N-acetyltransferase n=1 Tax=Capsaspora owczarzaki (strain ATCC 30864) TaxID=595528 RepID=A0A0D2WSP3_CAPO3|nr:N-acetyltransferase [Capsaspora owczarzaki ATCC 30864]KJE94503.1 N-acetyltransferase [Capsaspora owczarzaki ATCC 30864]|eukprot:XP_004346821.1 N-acetyltransferase [Capsaspora owczarzaki ATCC 30864]